MKTLYSLLIVALFGVLNVQAQQVDQVQRTLVSNMTATWCQYCGEWGLPLWDNIMTDNNNDKALPVVLHESSSSTLYSVAARDIYDQFEPASGTPRFYVNEQDANVTAVSGGTYPTLTRASIKKMVDSLYLIAPVANVGFNFTLSGNNLTVNSKSKFFQASSGEYYVNMYLVFRNVQKDQNVHNVGYVSTTHHELLRYSATSANNFGVSIVNGTIASGSEYVNAFTYALDASWNHSDITVLTLMWKKNGSQYQFVNGARKELSPTGIQDLAEQDKAIQIFPSLSSEKVFVKIDDNSSSNPVSIRVFDVTGRLISENNSNKAEFGGIAELSKAGNFGNHAGLYLVSVQMGEVRKTMRVVIN